MMEQPDSECFWKTEQILSYLDEGNRVARRRRRENDSTVSDLSDWVNGGATN